MACREPIQGDGRGGLAETLKAAGTGIDPPDALIAATALANGWTVATRSIKHMARTGAPVVNPWEQRL
ncbi:hypothetical protein [Streptomyces sp. NPDC005009]